MQNINLNPGGLIGALAGGGIAAAVIFGNLVDAESLRRPAKLVVIALIGGAFAGNFLWGLVFKPRLPDDSTPSDQDKTAS